MDTIGVICEFNPFHNGHKFLAENIKGKFKDCRIAGIMSGSFVQRGDCAVIDKYTRARQALKNGFDLIAELPTVYAVSSAEVFANAGARLADGLECNILAFGAESSLDLLEKIADLHSNNSFQENIKKELAQGKSYPKAIQEAALANFRGENADEALFSGSNNILAVEYLKAIKKYGIAPFAVERKAVAHDSPVTENEFASASAIRKMFSENSGDPYKYMPKTNVKDDFENLASMKNLEKAMLYKLRTMTREDFAALPDVSEGLENRMFSAVRNYNSVEEILAAVKTKRYTHARLRRILIYALLGVTKEMQKIPVPYVRVLGFNEKGAGILTEAKKSGKLPVITKVSAGIRDLSGADKRILEKDLLASDIWALAQNEPGDCGMDFYRKIVKF